MSARSSFPVASEPPSTHLALLLSSGPDPVSEASHFGAGVVALVFWASFGVLASNVVPNFVALFAGPLSVATDGLVTAAASALTPAVVLALYGRQRL